MTRFVVSLRRISIAGPFLVWTALIVVVLRHQDTPFRGEDWLDALVEVLQRGGYFDDRFSLARALRLENVLSASYGPVYYLYDVGRTLCFMRGWLPLNEVTFRFVTSGSAVAFLAVAAWVLGRRLNSHQVFAFVLLVGWSPAFVDHSRNYCVYPIYIAAQAVTAVGFLRLVERPGARRAATFWFGLLAATTTLATAVNEAVAYCLGLALSQARRDSGASAGPLEPFGRHWRSRVRDRRSVVVSVLAVATLAGVLIFNYQHRSQLSGNGGLYQGTFAKSWGKLSGGEVRPSQNMLALADEFTASMHVAVYPLLCLAVIGVVRRRRPLRLSSVLLVAFALALVECLFLVPGSQLAYSSRSIAWTLPLLIVIAVEAGALLAGWRWGWSILLALFALSAIQHPPASSDLASVLMPKPPVSQIKALGYLFRTSGLGRATKGCLGIDAALDGGGVFYMNRPAATPVLTQPRAVGSFCALVLVRPDSGAMRRVQRIVEQSRLQHRYAVVQHGRPPIEVYLDDATAAHWPAGREVDADDASRRFTNELRRFADLFEGWSR